MPYYFCGRATSTLSILSYVVAAFSSSNFSSIFRGDDGELRLGVRHAAQLKNGSAFPALYSQCSNLGTLANVAHGMATTSVFHIYYNPR
jgi:hypothetical protein